MIITIAQESFDIFPLQSVNSISRAAIYTIWTHDSVSDKYPLLYIGETGDLGQRIDKNHHKYQCWLNHAVAGLFIGIRLMPSSIYTQQQRKNEEQRLISLYNPPCNS